MILAPLSCLYNKSQMSDDSEPFAWCNCWCRLIPAYAIRKIGASFRVNFFFGLTMLLGGYLNDPYLIYNVMEFLSRMLITGFHIYTCTYISLSCRL